MQQRRCGDVEDVCMYKTERGTASSAASASLVSAYLSHGTVYLLTYIPSRSALTRTLIIIFSLPCHASRPGAATENKKFTCRLNEKTKNATSLRSC